MRRTASFPLLVLFLLSAVVHVAPQSRLNLSTAVTQLLDQPAPAATLKEIDEAQAVDAKWPREWFDTATAEPGPEAPPEIFIDYWEHQDRLNAGKQPSEASRLRMLEAVLREPRFQYSDLELIPDMPQTHDRIKDFLDRYERGELNFPEGAHNIGAVNRLRSWLRRHSAYFRDELVNKAREVRNNNGYLKDEDDLEALSKLDWQAASPIVESYIRQGSPAVRAFALGLKYQHFV